MKVLFCGYRDWSVKVLAGLEAAFNAGRFCHATTPEGLTRLMNVAKHDVVLVAGWSWKIPSDIVDNNVVIGMHPSRLPDYAGGSPIQHQILDGLKSSEATLFRLSSKLDGGDIVMSAPYSLEGHMTDVFDELTRVTTELFVDLMKGWPNVPYRAQEHVTVRKRLRPEQSCLPRETFTTKTCADIYDTIRCREDPYPNTYIEDETGRLTFKVVEFEPKP